MSSTVRVHTCVVGNISCTTRCKRQDTAHHSPHWWWQRWPTLLEVPLAFATFANNREEACVCRCLLLCVHVWERGGRCGIPFASAPESTHIEPQASCKLPTPTFMVSVCVNISSKHTLRTFDLCGEPTERYALCLFASPHTHTLTQEHGSTHSGVSQFISAARPQGAEFTLCNAMQCKQVACPAFWRHMPR